MVELFTNKFYAFHDPSGDELVPEQRAYLENYITVFEAQMNSASYASVYKNFVDVDSWIDYMLITELGKHIDGYKLSFYLHKKNILNDGKIHFGPLWDFNLAFGNFNFDCSPDPDGWSYDFQGTCDFYHPFWVKKMISIPQVQHQTACRWEELRSGALHTDSLMAFIDEKRAKMGGATTRNFDRWSTLGQWVWPNNFVGSSYGDEVNFLKNWLTQRLNWMDNNLDGNCDLYVDTAEEIEPNPLQIYPNPAQYQITVDKAMIGKPALFLLYDVAGTLVLKKKINSSSTSINLEKLANGVFFYKLIEESQQELKGKIIICR